MSNATCTSERASHSSFLGVEADKGHYALIPGRSLAESISLCAGEAHGVRVGAFDGFLGTIVS
jgi:hypothetical protein